MEHSILINESFSDDELILEKIEKKEFEDSNIFSLKLDAGEMSHSDSIEKLMCYDMVKDNLKYKLPHQVDGALYLLKDLNGTGLLADEVGLGKTVTAGLVLKECIVRGLVKKSLIITPPSLVDQWVAEMKEKFDIDLTIIENDGDWESAKYAIASVDRVKAYDKESGEYKHAQAHAISWDLLIVDEAHKLKSRTTTRWKFIDLIQKKRFLLLTATPFQNDLLELYNLLHLLKRGHLGTMQEFRKRFLFKGKKRHPLNPHELKKRLDEVMIRRKREETGIEYKQRMPRIEKVILSSEEKSVYDRICDLLKTKYFSASGEELRGKLIIYSILPKVTSSSRSAMESLDKIMNNEKYHSDTREIARQILEDYKKIPRDSKIEKLIGIVTSVFKEGKAEKMLIYTKHPTTLRYIVEKLAPYNYSIVEFLGGLDRIEKTKRIEEFKSSAQIMISTETGAEGLNFQFCNCLINYDLPWNPMSVEQRIGRLDRIGQKRDMYIYSLATKDTMEEHVVDLIINKMCCIGLVIGELPIILFNLGLDGDGGAGLNKIEEMLMNSFINSKNNLEIFSQEVEKIGELVQKGIEEYQKTKEENRIVLDGI